MGAEIDGTEIRILRLLFVERSGGHDRKISETRRDGKMNLDYVKAAEQDIRSLPYLKKIYCDARKTA